MATTTSFSVDIIPESGGAVVVEVDTVMISVGPVNDMDMTWTASFYFRQEWTDPRLILLTADPENRVQLGGDHINRLWLPDTYFSNSKIDRKHDVTVPNHLMYINITSGRVLFSQRLTVTLNCAMNLQKFPHDQQACDMTIESYSYNTKDLELKWSSSRSATDLLPTAFIPEFTIVQTTVEDCVTMYATGSFPCLRATVELSREIGYYITETYIPTILIVVLSWASFWIDHEAVPARISVGLLTVLTITTQISGSRAQLPKVPYIKAIDVWMSTNLVFVFVAYMEYAVVTVLSRRYKKTQSGQRSKSASLFKSLSCGLGSDSSLLEQTENATVDNRPKTKTNSRQPPSSTPYQNGSAGNGAYKPQLHVQRTSSYSLSSETVPAAMPPVLDTKDTGRRVDKISRFLFPFCFIIFNVIYWVYYLLLAP
ncbi:glycine receptor subunit alpha-4-like [Littorina saxatilis]|uniref:glycine receptor subunit alpha-4-like n=1 Tax=Littorina saxatilis TaxID=31220 RepID=UPI0038B4E30F